MLDYDFLRMRVKNFGWNHKRVYRIHRRNVPVVVLLCTKIASEVAKKSAPAMAGDTENQCKNPDEGKHLAFANAAHSATVTFKYAIDQINIFRKLDNLNSKHSLK